jgi:c(7)-type cytochrome triheme protein
MKAGFLVATAFAAVMVLCSGVAFSKVGGGDVEYKPNGAGKVIFQHEYHVKLKGMRCNNCHYNPFQMAAGSFKMKMETLTKGQFCGLCHNGKGAFDLVSTQNCKKCHQE